MRKAFNNVSLSRNFRNHQSFLKFAQSNNGVSQKNILAKLRNILAQQRNDSFGLSFTNRCTFATSNEEVQRKLIVPFKGYLSIRNSENMDMTFQTNEQLISFLVPKNSTVENVSELIKQKLDAQNVYMVCSQAIRISDLTPFEALLDRNFFLILNNDYSVKVEGQLLRPALVNSHLEGYKNLQLPLVTRKDIQGYCSRINSWIQAKYGAGFQNSTIKIPKAEAKKILIQSLVDPLESNSRIIKKQEQFRTLYWEVQELLDKKSLAVVDCSKMVRNRMSLGIVLIMANVGFIWSGTYIYYSWDIIEPIAYFISSLAGIVLCSRFFKIKRAFSLLNYKQYMIDKYMPVATRNAGLDLNELYKKQMMLAQLEAQIKDYYLKRL